MEFYDINQVFGNDKLEEVFDDFLLYENGLQITEPNPTQSSKQFNIEIHKSRNQTVLGSDCTSVDTHDDSSEDSNPKLKRNSSATSINSEGKKRARPSRNISELQKVERRLKIIFIFLIIFFFH